MSDVVAQVKNFVADTDPGGVIAMSLTGSSADGGLRPHSDLDFLLVTRRSLSVQERRTIVDYLLKISGSRATVSPGRPIELTCLKLDDVVPWRYPAACDFLYGEWLRSDYEAGELPTPHLDSNLPVLITSGRRHAIQLIGPALHHLLEPVPEPDLCQSLHDGLPALIDNLVGDETNVLLTLARMIVTLETGQIVPKDQAATYVTPTIPTSLRHVLTRAAQGYRGEGTDDWTTEEDASAMARLLADRIKQHGAGAE